MSSTKFSLIIDDENELIEEIQQESVGNEPTNTEAGPSSRTYKTTSIVWTYFDRLIFKKSDNTSDIKAKYIDICH